MQGSFEQRLCDALQSKDDYRVFTLLEQRSVGGAAIDFSYAEYGIQNAAAIYGGSAAAMVITLWLTQEEKAEEYENLGIYDYTLLAAVQNGNTGIVRIFLEFRKGDPAFQDNEPLRDAINNKRLGIVELLLADERVYSTASAEFLGKLIGDADDIEIAKLVFSHARYSVAFKQAVAEIILVAAVEDGNKAMLDLCNLQLQASYSKPQKLADATDPGAINELQELVCEVEGGGERSSNCRSDSFQ